MHTLLLTADLFTSSMLPPALGSAGNTLSTVASAEQLIERITSTATDLIVVDLLLVDLELSSLDLPALMESLREHRQPQCKVMAFGPHVQAGRLRAAREAGCDWVVPRSQLRASVESLLAE